METDRMLDSILTAAALTSTIVLLGAVFLLILRSARFQFSLRFLLFSMGCIAVALGLWTALLRTVAHRTYTGPGLDEDSTGAPPAVKPLPESPDLLEWHEHMDGPYQPQPLHPNPSPRPRE